MTDAVSSIVFWRYIRHKKAEVFVFFFIILIVVKVELEEIIEQITIIKLEN